MTGEDAVHRRISHGRPPGMDVDGKINHVWNLGSQLVKGQRVKPPEIKDLLLAIIGDQAGSLKPRTMQSLAVTDVTCRCRGGQSDGRVFDQFDPGRAGVWIRLSARMDATAREDNV